MYIKNDDNKKLLLDLFKAYFDTRKNKGSTANALAFAENYEEKLFKLHEEIISRKYTIGKSICFIVDKPVKREIFAADFRDRIVHHLIFNYINPIFNKHFIKDSYSCRIDKGTSYGIKRTNHFIRSCSENYQKDCWILKLDIQGYFMSINKNILYKKIESKLNFIKNPDFDISLVLYLIHTVVFHDPTKNCHIKGKSSDWFGLPKSKSLFFSKKEKGFPIGNLTSQLFGNIYLDEVDHFVHEKIGIKHYGRYVDDMLFVHCDKVFLKSTISEVREYLQDKLNLCLHPKKIYLQHFSNGVCFLGTFIKPWRIYIGDKTKQNFYAKAKIWNGSIENNHGFKDEKEKYQFIAFSNSYLGIMGHYNTCKLRQKMISNFSDEIKKSMNYSWNFKKISLNNSEKS